jgi:hypothetical protein
MFTSIKVLMAHSAEPDIVNWVMSDHWEGLHPEDDLSERRSHGESFAHGLKDDPHVRNEFVLGLPHAAQKTHGQDQERAVAGNGHC